MMSITEVSPPILWSCNDEYIPFSDKIETAREKGLKHFNHDHLLIFKEVIKDEIEGEDVCCNGCGLVLRGCAFSCSAKCHFHLHEFCAFLPRQMEHHPRHSEHPLTLLPQSPYPSSRLVCDVCHKRCSSGFTYHCDLCRFDVDLSCAVLPLLVCGRLHNHLLSPQLYLASFLCSVCGEKHEEGMSYQCRTCSFWIHEHCYSLPWNIEHGSHPHPLSLVYKLRHGLTRVCGICEEKINYIYSYYNCEGCNYFVHVKCSSKKWETIIEVQVGKDHENAKLMNLPAPNVESVHQVVNQFIKQICQPEDSDRDDGEECKIDHPSHDHPLVLYDGDRDEGEECNIHHPSHDHRLELFDAHDKPGTSKLCPNFVSKVADLSLKHNPNNQTCNACVLPILDRPFYNCILSCGFNLHKWCAKLPREVRSPGHPGHTLILQERLTECLGFFRCKGCMIIGNGFAFKCTECEDYYLDVRCASLPSSIMHETHEHPLLLKHGRFIGGCPSCGGGHFDDRFTRKNWTFGSSTTSSSSRFTFGCDACHFSLHIGCSLLPRQITHWYDQHGFTLTYSPPIAIKDGVEPEYYCEFCETRLNPKGWVYHCFQCEKSAGTRCILWMLNLSSFTVKYGESYESPHHPHPLTCIKGAKTEFWSCDRCHEKRYGLRIGFDCALCKIILCPTCACSP